MFDWTHVMAFAVGFVVALVLLAVLGACSLSKDTSSWPRGPEDEP